MAAGAAPSFRLKSFTRSVLDMLRMRFELAGVELAQEQARIGWLALLAALALVLVAIGLQLVAVVAVGWYWDTPYRVPVAAAACAVFLASGAGFAVAFFSALRAKPRPFDGSLLALAADVEALT